MTPSFCANCGRTYGRGEEPPCPACGDSRRTFQIQLADSVETRASLSGTHRRPGVPRGWVTKFKERTKLSALGKLARESLRIDRSDPTKTVKTHHVEEQRADGTWETVHDERVDYPAKRRPSE